MEDSDDRPIGIGDYGEPSKVGTSTAFSSLATVVTTYVSLFRS